MHKILHPFKSSDFNLDISAKVSMTTNLPNPKLELTYLLNGDIHSLFPFTDHPPTNPLYNCTRNFNLTNVDFRKNELWKSTCFEWFIGFKNSPLYWEFNLSPEGYWNFYEFSSYRSPLQESDHCIPRKFHCKLEPLNFNKLSHATLELFIDIDISILIQKYPTVLTDGLMAITGVAHWKNNDFSYYSLSHPREKPDFHHRGGFTIELDRYLQTKKQGD